MAHYAKVENTIVTEVIVAEQDFIDSLPDKEKCCLLYTSPSPRDCQ